jgi:predicted GH43/DUF377 family glycosyl hydrolase
VHAHAHKKQDDSGTHAIGIATSSNGVQWQRHSSGKPVFERSSEPGAWDSGAVTSPRIVDLGDGVYWMFYVGYGSEKGGPGRIGVAKAENNDLTKWTRIGEEEA